MSHGGQFCMSPNTEMWSIPASAGEPTQRTSRDGRNWVYPRECGGTDTVADHSDGRWGLSPRVRGNHLRRLAVRRAEGSIPASAGEPGLPMREHRLSGVYPRECGGTVLRPSAAANPQGLSPRVRGNLCAACLHAAHVGSIPASAGEPSCRPPSIPKKRVYPRECGGTLIVRPKRRCPPGLSPRVRGNLRGYGAHRGWLGSIPASAGEPEHGQLPRYDGEVYPRECGGTRLRSGLRLPQLGLSPRVRGNQEPLGPYYIQSRSIPASAGEPGGIGARRRRAEVYPRECGGTSDDYLDKRIAKGLSPRVRGNPCRRAPQRTTSRSIPASAGEPPGGRPWSIAARVYPRECGGTGADDAEREIALGLSPRVRGNPRTPPDPRGWTGSIPASAGEPPRDLRAPGGLRVYPRECGGTLGLRLAEAETEGLSPRVRGNHRGQGDRVGELGSIPASAGEPPFFMPFPP